MKRAFGTLVCIVLALLLIGFAALSARQRTRERLEEIKNERIERVVREVKSGNHSVGLMHSELLPLLAREQECIDNLTDITFWADVDPEDARHMESLANVKSLFFYCTDPSQVIQHAQSLPIETIVLELAQLTPEDIQALGQIKSLKIVKFQGQRISSGDLAILHELPDRVEVDLQDCTIEPLARPQPER